MDFENMSIWCWLIPALTGLICGILGYLIGKGSREVVDNSADIQIWKDKNAKLSADLDACRNKLSAAPAPSVVSSIAPAAALIAFDADNAKAIFGKKIKQDDLKVVEGIGPKIEGLFHNFDIKTWKALSDVSVAKCQEVLDSGGDRYKIHDPSSWPMQAKMCYENKWKDLLKWQDEHKHGKL